MQNTRTSGVVTNRASEAELAISALHRETMVILTAVTNSQQRKRDLQRRGPALIPGSVTRKWYALDTQITAYMRDDAHEPRLNDEITECQRRISNHMSLSRYPEANNVDIGQLYLLLATKLALAELRRAAAI
ncbi:hypothetical protein CGMCC3_g16627 [Colletotrichum fructicola]|nr:uncharacterized protein CGMCC3_g16627 [Colletotrichum fructicola]KAE9567226.1 hypothetical protein CGMCC3_g16627 [Colletotrichum fructicola]